METSRRLLIMLLMIAMTILFGCSDDEDDPTTPPEPEDPRVESVVMAPTSATYSSIGEEIQFTAMAFDQEDAVIDSVITWMSSDPAVVSVDENGGTLATGLGSAEIYAMSGSAADTADVAVTLDGATATEWIADGNGDWHDGNNWSGGEVPGSGDVAVITAAGDYTVTLNGDVMVDGLVLGDGTGTQTLDTNNYNLQANSGGLYTGGSLLVQDELTILGDMVWAGGDVDGGGVIEIMSSAELHVTANPLDVDADINNNGTLMLHTGSSLRINDSLDNNSGGLVELQGDAYLTVQLNGWFNNSGTILKSLGAEEATILASSVDDSELTSIGPVRVDMGTLAISGGSLRGHFDIADGAVLRQSGSTELLSANMTGNGTFVIGGRVTLGTYASQIIDIPHLILDSGSTPAITGEASLVAGRSFVWRRGVVASQGSLTTQVHSLTTFEDGGTKALTGTNLTFRGDVHGDSAVDLDLRDGAEVTVDFPGSWHQDGGGTITQGVGDTGRFNVIGDFEKTGEGIFSVAPEFTCSGTMELRGGMFDGLGDFTLFDTGVITGGGDDIDDPDTNIRLRLLNATSAEIRGTIEPDLDGEPAVFAIQGLVDMASSALIRVDVALDGPFNTEYVHFVTSGQTYGGTLFLNVLRPVDPGVDYRFIRAFAAQGGFTVENDLQFDEIEYDSEGVVGRQLTR